MITDEMVEAVARAMCDTWGYLWDGDPDDAQTAPETCIDVTPGKGLYREAARAAIAAVLPMIRAEVLEEAAMVADGYHQRALAWARTVRDLEKHIDETDSSRIATAIRALGGDK